MYTPDKLSHGLFYASCIHLHSCILCHTLGSAFNSKIHISIGTVVQLIFKQKSICTSSAEKHGP